MFISVAKLYVIKHNVMVIVLSHFLVSFKKTRTKNPWPSLSYIGYQNNQPDVCYNVTHVIL